MAEYLQEVAVATKELVEESCCAIIAVSRALATLCRLVVQVVTVMLAVTCLVLAVGAWAFGVGKSIWFKMSA